MKTKEQITRLNMLFVIKHLLFIPYIIIKSWILCITAIVALFLIMFNIDIMEPIDDWTDKFSPI